MQNFNAGIANMIAAGGRLLIFCIISDKVIKTVLGNKAVPVYIND